MEVIKKNDIQKVKSILENGIKENKIYKLNGRDKDGYYPLLKAVENDDIKMTVLLMGYANKYGVNLEIREKNNDYGTYPLVQAVNNNNIEMVQLLLKYADSHEIKLDLNKKTCWGSYPLLEATIKDNITIVKLIFNYAEKHNFKLYTSISDLEDFINRHRKQTWCPTFSQLNSEIMKLWKNYNYGNKV